MISKSRRSTSRSVSAAAAGKLFGVPLAFDNHHDLVNSAAVDVVAITVKVPYHFELAADALTAGKAVYCEWPRWQRKKACLPWSGCRRGPRPPLRMFMI